MNQVMKLPYYDEQISVLIRLSLLQPRLKPQDILSLIEYEEITSRKLRKISSNESEQRIVNTIKIAIQNLKQELGCNFLFLVKKCSFIHLFLHQIAKARLLSSRVAETINLYLREVVDKDVKAVLEVVAKKKDKEKREGSLSKIYNAVRSLSKSKKQMNREKSILKFEQSDDKRALREIIQKIVNPWALYLLKLAQDPLTYSSTLSKSFSRDQWASLKWKLSNYLTILGSITLDLNRLGKYFKDQLIGSWVFIDYVMSTDIAIYYNLIGSDLSSRCCRWNEKIIMIQKLSKINKVYKDQLRQISQNESLIQIKKEAESLIEIKEKIIYLYHNTVTSDWDYLMIRPFRSGEKQKVMESIEFILDFYAHQSKIHSTEHKETSKLRRTDRISSLVLQSSRGRVDHEPKIIKNQSEINTETPESIATIRQQYQKQQQAHVRSIWALTTNINPSYTRKNNLITNVKNRVIKP